MELQNLTAISPIDGRYRNQLQQLDFYFSEFALIRYRVQVEVDYFIFLSEKKFFKLSTQEQKALKEVVSTFSIDKAAEIKNLESITNHDVKAVEYFLKKELDFLQLSSLKEWIHFGLTSQDINNTAIPLLWKDALENELMPAYSNLLIRLRSLAKD